MLKKLVLLNILVLLSASSVYAQKNDESKGFYRIGIGSVDFEHSSYLTDPAYDGHIHFHEAAITANFVLGHGTDKLRSMFFVDPAIVDGVRGSSTLSIGGKTEVGIPWLPWLKLGGGVAYSYNHAKISDDVIIYERADLDTAWSPFGSVTFLPRSKGPARFFADIRVGKAYGGDVVQPQTGKSVADIYVSVSLGTQIKLGDN